ncbi:MAG: disulfide bond formation protein B [Betaproteobacteria bacterium]
MNHLPTQRWLALLAAACLAMLAFGIVYLQNHLGLEPCPMCIVQRYALIAVIVWCVLGVSANAPVRTLVMTWLIALTAGFGAFVAARQSWLQWYPPEVVSCGRDFYGMIENFPLQRAVPMIFKGSGDCTKIDWTFLGGSIANWSFVVFMGIFVLMLLLRIRDGLFRTPSNLESLEPLS